MEVNEIIFLIEDDPEGGYSARALGHSIYTQGESKEELRGFLVPGQLNPGHCSRIGDGGFRQSIILE